MVSPVRRPLNVTIYTDASHCPDSRLAGYGIFIRSSYLDGPFRYGACSSGYVKNSTVAEMEALLLGIVEAKKLHEDYYGECLYILVTDSQAARDIASGLLDATPKWATGWLERFKDATRGIRYKVNKVKAHSGVKCPRSYVNNQVDKIARQHLRFAREAKRKSQRN